MILGQWKTVTVAASGTTSSEVDLGLDFKQILVLAPALDSATIAVQIAQRSGGTFFNQYALDADATGDFAHATTAATAAKAVLFNCGAQFIKVVCSAAQTSAERTFYVRGIN